jgi:adenosylcobinamide-GDP ribazoletransferase
MDLMPFWIALQFLTRIPAPVRSEITNKQLGRSVIAYPLVGSFIGLILLGIAEILNGLDTPLLSAIVLLVWILITGGLHLDGLADCADAWIGGQASPERSLKIMKDPCAGPMAVVALVLLLLLKQAAIEGLIKGNDSAALVLAPVVGRTAILALMLSTPYVRPGGTAEKLIEYFPRRLAGYSIALVLLIILIVLGPWPLLGNALVFFGLRSLMLKRLGGATGDTYGASIEILETVVLLIPGRGFGL